MGFGKSIKKAVKKVAKSIKKGFKKISKATGISKVWNKIKKGIKSAFSKFGKFMGKIGIVGQVAMMFILPGVGNALMGALGGLGQAALASSNVFVQGAAKAAQFAMKAVKTVGNVYKNVTSAVTNTLGNFTKALGNKMGIANAGPKTFFGKGGAFDASFGKASRFQNLTKDPSSFLNKMDEVVSEYKPSNADQLSGLQSPDTSRVTLEGTTAGQTSQAPSFFERPLVEEPPKAGLFEKVKQGVTEGVAELPDKIKQGIKEAPDKLIEKVVDAPARFVDTAVHTQAQAAILGDDYQTPQTTVVQGDSYSTYVPPIEQAQMNVYDFASEPVVAARAFETNVLQSQTPYGHTAYQYNENYNNYFRNFAA